MDTEQERRHPTPHLFTLRMWEEALGEGKAEWRGRIQELSSGETAFFHDWPGLVATLTRLLNKPAERDGTTAGAAEAPEPEESRKHACNSC